MFRKVPHSGRFAWDILTQSIRWRIYSPASLIRSGALARDIFKQRDVEIVHKLFIRSDLELWPEISLKHAMPE
eukprot:8264651-Pyramimonas_sp.AAC.1